MERRSWGVAKEEQLSDNYRSIHYSLRKNIDSREGTKIGKSRIRVRMIWLFDSKISHYFDILSISVSYNHSSKDGMLCSFDSLIHEHANKHPTSIGIPCGDRADSVAHQFYWAVPLWYRYQFSNKFQRGYLTSLRLL